MIEPRKPVPALSVPLVGGGRYTLGDPRPRNFSLVVFWRGLHCGICRSYLNSLQSMLGGFEALGVDVVAPSMESAERAERCRDDWGLDRLRLGYGVGEATARDWGLYLTARRAPDEPELFCEPGLFLVQSSGVLSAAVINTGPQLRANPAEVLALVESRLEAARA